MKNTNIENLKKEVPVNIRLEVYKEAINRIENKIHGFTMKSFGLCILLPCILWDLDSFMDKDPRGKDWEFKDATKAFPELTERVIYLISRGESIDGSNRIRLEYLKKWVKKLEKK